jgi:hypothetical protein
VSAIEAFLKAIPQAAQSPLALVAYVMVVAAWVLRAWLKSRPASDALKILKLYEGDSDRTKALEKLVGVRPPSGLTGNEAILTWVRINSADKSKVLIVFVWIATVLAILVFAVAVKNAKNDVARPVTILLHRSGTVGDCPTMPLPTKLDIISQSGQTFATVPVVEGCKATVMVPGQVEGVAKIALKNSAPFILTSASDTYQLSASSWEVSVSEAELGTHMRISLFTYGGQCSEGTSAFNTFREILKSKAASLRPMFPPSDARYNYLNSILVNDAGRQLNMTVSEVHNYWEQTGSLQVLSGLCFVKDGGEVMQSQIFFGSLAGTAPEPFFAEMPISANEFGTTRDIHTASILYALGEEAVSRHLDREVVTHYLATARDIAIQIHTSPARTQLLQAIEQSLRDAGAPVPEHL